MIWRRLLCLALVLPLSLGVASPTAARTGGCAIFGRTPTSTAYLPNVTRSLGGPGGWETPFIIQNVGDTPTTMDINFANILDGSRPDGPSSLADRCLEGVSLAPGRSFALIPSTFADLPDNTSWAVSVFSYGSKVVGLVNEQRGVGDQQEAMAYSGFNGGATKVYLPNAADDYFGYQTPIIIENIGTQDAVVEASFVSFDGTQVIGMFVDWNRRRPIMITAGSARAAALLSVAVALLAGSLTLGHLYVVAAINGLITTTFLIAYQSYLPGLVGHHNLLKANSRLQLSFSGAAIAGPALAGVLIQYAGAGGAVLTAVGLSLASVPTLVAIAHREVEPESTTPS